MGYFTGIRGLGLCFRDELPIPPDEASVCLCQVTYLLPPEMEEGIIFTEGK